MNGLVVGGTDGLPQHFGIERQLVAEVVVHGRDIRACAQADFPHRGRVITMFRKDLSGGFEQFGAGGVLHGRFGRLGGGWPRVESMGPHIKREF